MRTCIRIIHGNYLIKMYILKSEAISKINKNILYFISRIVKDS